MNAFKEKLNRKEFVITAELEPPKGTDTAKFIEKAHLIKDWVDAVNVTDNQRAVLRLSSAAGCTILKSIGIEPIFQVTSRDRNRLAIQSDLLGISALGISNVLAISGDYPTLGDHPGSKVVYDVDSVNILDIIAKLNNGIDMQERPLEGATSFFAGAVFNSNTDLLEPQYFKIMLKVEKGARFFQPQIIYDLDRFKMFIDGFEKYGIERDKLFILAGILPLRSAKNAIFINKNVPGVNIPPQTIERLEQSDKPALTGMDMAAEMIHELKSFCDGVHIMTIGREQTIPELLQIAGFTKKDTSISQQA